jgi:hypothetical protein
MDNMVINVILLLIFGLMLYFVTIKIFQTLSTSNASLMHSSTETKKT